MIRRARFAAALALLLVGSACGDRPRPEVPRQVGAVQGSDSAVVDRPRAVALEAAPSPFTTACLRGDPAEGIAWAVDGVDPAFIAVPLEPLAALQPRDSAQLAARIARTVDVLPSDTSIADFRGLPVSVRTAWRLASAVGDTIVVSVVARRLPIESNPLEESFFLVAAPGVRQGVRSPLLERWVLREVGPEEAMAARDLVAAYGGPEDELTLVLVHDAESGVRAELLMRRAGEWRVEWAGPLPTCVAR